MTVAARIAAMILCVVLVLGTCLSVVKTVVVPRAIPSMITRSWFLSWRRLFRALAPPRRSFAYRDRVMAFYAPITFLLLPLLWVGIVSAGYTFGHWAVDQKGWRDAFVVSGSSMLTLGVQFHANLPSAALSFSQAMLGLGLVALLISYLPTIYGSFSRRELLVGLLETRAGMPPSPYEMLVRYRRIGAFDEMSRISSRGGKRGSLTSRRGIRTFRRSFSSVLPGRNGRGSRPPGACSTRRRSISLWSTGPSRHGRRCACGQGFFRCARLRTSSAFRTIAILCQTRQSP